MQKNWRRRTFLKASSAALAMGAMGSSRAYGANEKILALELKKVKYIRSLSFIQGTCVNALRTAILGLMMYLVFQRDMTLGQFFSLWI